MEEVKPPKMIAHKGKSFLLPENSREAIMHAYQDSEIDGVEVDIRMTKDHHLVLSHNMDLFFMCRGIHLVKDIKDCTLEQLNRYQKCDNKIERYIFYLKFVSNYQRTHTRELISKLHKLKNKSGHWMTLTEALTLLPEDQELAIEIKGNDEDYKGHSFTDQIIKEVNPYQNKKIQLYGRDLKMVDQTSAALKNVRTGGLVDKRKDAIPHDLDAIWVNIETVYQYPALIEDCLMNYGLDAGNERELYCWTIDRLDQFKMYLELFTPLVMSGRMDYPAIVSNNIDGMMTYWKFFHYKEYDVEEFKLATEVHRYQSMNRLVKECNLKK